MIHNRHAAGFVFCSFHFEIRHCLIRFDVVDACVKPCALFCYSLVCRVAMRCTVSLKSASQSISLSVCLSVYLSVYLSVCLSFCLSVCLSVCLLVRQCFCSCVCLFVCLLVCLCVCLSDKHRQWDCQNPCSEPSGAIDVSRQSATVRVQDRS